MAFSKRIQKLVNDIELVKTLTVNALKKKYKRSKLGLFWSMLNPILKVSVIALVFSHIINMSYTEFTIFFFSGFLAWNLFSESVLTASNSLLFNEYLIKKVPINLAIFPLVSIGINAVEFLLAMATVSLLLTFIGLKFSLALLFLPFAFLLLVCFSTGLVLLVSLMTAFFRDFSYIFLVLMQLWFYLTPILYPKDFLSGKIQWWLKLNPMTIYIDLFRNPIVYHQICSGNTIILASILSFTSLALGVTIFNKYKSDIVFKL